jgi:hypothetical protein
LPRRDRRPFVLVAITAVGVLLAVSVGLVVRTGGGDGSPDAPVLTQQQSSQLAGWLRANTGQGAVIAAPSALRPALEAGLGDRQVVTLEDNLAPGTDLVVLPQGWQHPPHGLPVARLTTSSQAVDVLAPRRDAASVQAEVRRRVVAGRRLVESVNLRLTPRAWTMLADGKVDLGVVALLRRLLRAHTLEVSSFPRDGLTAAAGAPARTVDITGLDGAMPSAGLIRTARSQGTQTHLGRDRGRPALVVGLLITGKG